MWGLQRSLWFALVVIISIFTVVNAFNVDLYEQKHFKGKHVAIDVRKCTDIPDEWDDLTSSVSPAECIIIFKHPNCQGPRVRLEPHGFGTAYLREINFEDKLSSVAPCSFSATKEQRRDEY